MIRAMQIGVSIANDSRESIRANRVANRLCDEGLMSVSFSFQITCQIVWHLLMYVLWVFVGVWDGVPAARDTSSTGP